ncbi:MAG: tRNA (5-methylaminomethyl-2-thiouridine)(34)-methyltransferase MnmD [Bacteroidota bacterium]|nr:tRNA (5-methylaminomethyl-2-thiouridine)(34)-methyltransferase MnmD [Bacteroidota bacterium]
MLLATSPDLLPYRTADGSYTLRSKEYDEGYHSVVGAINESTHVYIFSGLNKVIQDFAIKELQRPIDLLEVGLGTGLNLLLTWIRCLEGKCKVNYTALEPFPLPHEKVIALAHWDDLAWPALKEPFMKMMFEQDKIHLVEGGLNFSMRRLPVQELEDRNAFDLVYFDAFAPNNQPEMWKAEVFDLVYRSMRTDGILVTYCAKGEVRRTLRSIGFQVERIQGPPGKREMIRARK